MTGHESRVKVFGFVDNIRQLMGAADFLVTKAGGLTLREALAADLPVISFGSLPGQEARNERFAAMAGVALVAGSRRSFTGSSWPRCGIPSCCATSATACGCIGGREPPGP